MNNYAPFTVGMLLYPRFSLLDLAGPQFSLGMHGRTLLLSKDGEPVVADNGIRVIPTTTFAECPARLDVLFVPGGWGTNEAMKDGRVLDFLAAAGATARYVTSVCSGSLLLGMAGLLEGYRSATHWACYDALAATGAVPVKQRVVVDRNRISAGGTTAGIDFGLTLLAVLRDEYTAGVTQLLMEYDPHPPYDCGTPAKARPGMQATALDLLGGLHLEALNIIAGGRRSAA